MPEQIPGWEGTQGPFPSQYGKPHVYARDVQSGAGNCVCGAAPGHRRHVQIAPGVDIPDRMRPDTALRPMTDQDTAMTIAHMNHVVSVAQVELVISLLRGNGWTSPADRQADSHPYVHLTYGPWEPSGHQCGDILPGGCDEPIDERKVTAQVNVPGEEHLIGWEFRDCPSCAPRPDVPDVPEPPDDRPTADRNAVDRARTDGGTRALIARAIWTRDTQPTTGAQCGGYVYEIADRVACEAVPEVERRAVEAERAAIVKGIKDYFAASDDPLYEDVRVLCGRIERGEYGARKEGR